jgi:putative transposase
MVEEMLAARGTCVTYETVRQWGKKFGKIFADQIRQRAPARGDQWHMDEGVPRKHQQKWGCGAA